MPILNKVTDEQVGILYSFVIIVNYTIIASEKINLILLFLFYFLPQFVVSSRILTCFHNIIVCKVNDGVRWSPSTLIHRLGKEINNPDSVYYWAYKNDIPVFCPAITDGSLGDMMFFHNYKRPEFQLDLVQDIRLLNDLAVKASCSGMIILGGGVVKHHTCNANLMRNGADFSVFINTGQVRNIVCPAIPFILVLGVDRSS